ncbi:amd1 [Symbiodinium microadriaticum]|nr:amd1 [Symbiodinium microadriaticum]CAE7945877.1 amd1 [Symbiodinium sp. KB8]
MAEPTPFFEGTEKRIEIDFRGEADLRNADPKCWEEVVQLSATQILNCKKTDGFTSFLLSESSLIVYPGKAIIKTCGRTVPLNAVAKILEVAKGQGLELEWMCYSRKNFLAPEEQPHEHQSMETEVDLCKRVFGSVGDAYILGPLTGEHWLFYDALYLPANYLERGDFTIDVMMYDLPKTVQEVFHTTEPEGSRSGAEAMTRNSGLQDVADFLKAEVDDYCFEGCGYSCNMHTGLSYAMVHVTPQDNCSYASFETNFGSTLNHLPSGELQETLNTLLGKVIDAFSPGRLTLTLLLDVGAIPFLGSAPFAAADARYKRRSYTSTKLGQSGAADSGATDYVATIANFDKK